MDDNAENSTEPKVEVSISEDYGEGIMSTSNPDGSFSTATEAERGMPEPQVLSEEELDAELDASLKEGDETDPEAKAGEEETPKEDDKPESVAIDLPDFDPEKPEVAEQYRAKYLAEDGNGLNFTAFNDSFYANLEKGLVDINPQERAFVKAEMKLSDQAIDTYLNGLAKQVHEATEAQGNALAATYGDKEGYTAAMEWAKSEGYTQAQKDRFNAAMEAGDPDLLTEQVELLKVRFLASGKAPAAKVVTPAPATKQRRAVSPEASSVSVGAAAGANGGLEPFASIADFNKEQAAAYATGDIDKMNEVERRLKASPKLWKGQG